MSDPKIKNGTQNQALHLNLLTPAPPSAKQTLATLRHGSAQPHPPKQNAPARNKQPERGAPRATGDEPSVRPDKQQRAENTQRQQAKQEQPAHLRELEDRDARRALNAHFKERPTEKALRQPEHPRNADRQQPKAERNNGADRYDRGARSNRNESSSHGDGGVRRAQERGRESGVRGYVRESDLTGRESQRNPGRSEFAQLRRETHGAQPSLLDYLKGDKKSGRDLPTHLREVLDGTTRSVGRNALRALGAGRDERVGKFVDQFAKKLNRSLERPLSQGETSKALVREAVRELSSVVHMAKHFARLEKRGGEIVRRAEERVFKFLQQQSGQGSDGSQPRIRTSELWRDLRSGAFQPAPDAHDPFPLTGRARVASEMIELMHTLDAIEHALQKLGGRAQGNGQAGVAEEGAVFLSQTGGSVGANGEPEEVFVRLPTLPGRAARGEIERFIASLSGQLLDAHGRSFTTPDGMPLKFDQLLWLGTSGAMHGIFEADAFPTQLSPLHIYGFDALYSLIGFDGRTLNAPRYAAVQIQINASELESIFGQQPLSEGWMRALIERLKDSAHADHNTLGEMLEMALADGRLHTVLVSGSVNQGVATESSFNVAKLLPNIAGETVGLSPA